MSNKNCGPDIVKYFVVEPVGGTVTGSTGDFYVCSGTTFVNTISGCTDSVNFNNNIFYNNGQTFFSNTLSACTGIYTSNLYGCSPITIHDNLILLSGLTFNTISSDNSLTQILVRDGITGEVKYRDVSSITPDTNTFVTGGTYNSTTDIITLTRNDGGTIDITGVTDNFVVAGSYSDVTDTISLLRQDGSFVNITGVTDTFTTGATYDNGTALVTFTKNDGTSFTLDLSTIDVNDTFVTGGTLTNTDLILDLNDGSSTSPIDLSGLVFTGNTSSTCIGDIYVSNIHSCSPLRINSNDEGNVYFGSTSGVTIDILNQRVGIGTNNPSVELHVKGSASILRLETTQSQNSNFVEFHDPSERKGWIGYPGSTSSTDSFFIRNEEHGSKIIISTTDISGTSRTAINIDGNHDVQIPFGNFDVAGVVNIGTLGTGTSVNNLGIDASGNVVIGATGDTDTNTFVTGGTLSGNDLILEKNNGVDVNPIDLSGLVSGKTDLTLFNSHTGDTNNPHQTSFSNLTSTAHTHTISDVINLQTELDGKLNVSDFNTYSGNVQTQIDSKLNITDFNTYSGNVQTELNTKISGATNLSSEGVFAQKNGLDLEFKGITSTGGTVNISSDSTSVNLEVTTVGSDKFVSGGTYNGGTKEINFVGNSVETTFDVDLTSLVSSLSGDTFVTGQTFSNSTFILSTTRNDGTTFNTDLSVLATDVYVLSGVYNPATGIVTYTNSTGGTFQVSGFTTGMTDSYTTAANLNGETIEFDNNIQGSNLYNVSLSPVLSGKTDLTLFNSHTGDTNNPHQTSFGNLTSTAHTHSISEVINLQTELDSKTNNTDFISHTGDTTIHFTKSSINLSDLGSSAHTHTLSEINDFNAYSGSVQTQIDSKLNISDFNTYSGNVQTQLDTKIENGINSGGANEVFSGKSGTDLYFRTISGGSNTTITTIDDIIKVDVSVPVDTNTFVTGGTYNPTTDVITLTRNDAVTIDITGVTDNFVVAGSYSDSTDTISLLRQDGSFVNVTGVTDTFTTGATYDNGTATATFTKNDGTTYSLDLSTIDVNDTFVTGGTFSSETLTLTRNDGGDIIVTGFSSDNFYVTGFTYNDANTLTISRNGGLGDLSVTINTLTGLTIDGVLSASTYTGITLNDLDDVTTNIPSTPDNTYQGELLYFDVVSNQWVSGSEYGNLGEVTIWGKKGSAGTIDKGCPVYIVGFDDDLHEVELANATTATTMPVIGFTAEDFDNAGVYPIVTFGKITGLDTTSTVSTLNPNGETWVVNDVLYMDKTDGGLTKNRPSGTNTEIQRVAKVLRVASNSGQLFIFNTARTAGLPNLTSDYLWVGNGLDRPLEIVRTDVGITTTGFTYNDNNTFTITDDNGGSLTSTFNQVSGLTINGDLDVIGDTTLNTLTATSITSNSAIDVFNGHINLRDNSYFLQGRTVADVNVSLIGVDNQDRVFVGNAGYDTYIDSDTIVDGSLTATTLTIGVLGTGASVTNLGIDGSGNVVSGTTGGSGEVNTASNLGGGTGLFAQKNGVDLEFKSITSTGGTVTITNNSTTVNIESAGGTGVSDANKIFSWFMTV